MSSTSPALLAPQRSAPRRPRLSVVPRPRVSPASRMPFVVLVSLVLLAGVIGLLCFNTQMQQASFAATALERQATTLAARQQTLIRELEALRNPQRLAEAAQAQGLVIPTSSCTLSLANGSATPGCGPATGESTPRLHEPPPAKPAIVNPTRTKPQQAQTKPQQAQAQTQAQSQPPARGPRTAPNQTGNTVRHQAEVRGSGGAAG